MSPLERQDRFSSMELVRKYAVIITAVALVVIGVTITGGTFLSGNNLLNVGERAAMVGIVSLGQMLVILTGAIDLSVSGILAFGLAVSALMMNSSANIPMPVVIVATLLVTTLCGSINGLLASKTKIPPFMMTLATYLIYQSAALVISGASNLKFEKMVEWMTDTFHLTSSVSRFLPTAAWILISALIISVLSSTTFGKNVYTTGANGTAGYLSGVNVQRIRFMVYALSGLLCGIAAIIIEFRMGRINPTSSTASYQIDSIAAVIVGGASLSGGEGNVYGTFVGAFIMASLINIMNLIGLDVYSQDMIKGIVLVVFVFITQYLSNAQKN